ncbi:MAG TPA: carboxymuconolactone decarboxylase family protein [Pirellulales bacterium]|nr:carboxymuconolactone decarboxylase family protein [Pirellulales bacterium]
MLDLKPRSIDSAPATAQGDLRAVQSRYGFVPNLLSTMANAPPLLRAYLQVTEQFSRTSLSAAEQQVVLLAASAANECSYCVAAHSVIAKMQHVPDDVVEAIRNGRPIDHPRLEALRVLAAELVARRGWPAEASISAFLAADFAPEQVLEVVLGVGMKTLSNYTNHIVHTQVDEPFAAAEWSPPADVREANDARPS